MSGQKAQAAIAGVSDTATRDLLTAAFGMIEGLQKEVSSMKGEDAAAASPVKIERSTSGKTVLVSGFFDIMHSGHIKFFNDAAGFGKVSVCVGTNENHRLLRGNEPTFGDEERLYMVQNQASVSSAFLSTGTGDMDFEAALDEQKPDIFYVTHRGDSKKKRTVCESRGIKYVVGPEEVEQGMEVRTVARLKAALSTSGPRTSTIPKEDSDLRGFPWRICLAGGWLDQPWVSQICPGSCIVVNVHPHEQFKTRSGLATSTRTYG